MYTPSTPGDQETTLFTGLPTTPHTPPQQHPRNMTANGHAAQWERSREVVSSPGASRSVHVRPHGPRRFHPHQRPGDCARSLPPLCAAAPGRREATA
jgi:hypothetical protein